MVTKTLIFVSGIHYSDFYISSQSKRNLCFDVLKNKPVFSVTSFLENFTPTGEYFSGACASMF